MDLSSLKVTELKAELQKRHLQVKGLKKDLVERLQQAINNETQDQAQGQEQNTGNDADVDVDLGGAEEGGDAGEGGMEIDAPLPQDTNGRSSSPSKKTPKKSNKTGATTTTTPTPGTGKKSGGGGKKRKRSSVSAGVLGGGGEGLVKGGAAPGEGVGENQEEEVTVDAAGVAAGEVTKVIQGDDEKKEEEEDKRRIAKNDDDEKNGSHNDGDKGETKQGSGRRGPSPSPPPPSKRRKHDHHTNNDEAPPQPSSMMNPESSPSPEKKVNGSSVRTDDANVDDEEMKFETQESKKETLLKTDDLGSKRNQEKRSVSPSPSSKQQNVRRERLVSRSASRSRSLSRSRSRSVSREKEYSRSRSPPPPQPRRREDSLVHSPRRRGRDLDSPSRSLSPSRSRSHSRSTSRSRSRSPPPRKSQPPRLQPTTRHQYEMEEHDHPRYSHSPSPPARSRSRSPSRRRRAYSIERSWSRSRSRSRSLPPRRTKLGDYVSQDTKKKGHDESSRSKPTLPPPSRAIYISNLVRPFTAAQLRALLETAMENGEGATDGDDGGDGKQLEKFWLDNVKSHAWVVYPNLASSLRASELLTPPTLDRWPLNTGNPLSFLYVPVHLVDSLIEEEMRMREQEKVGRTELEWRWNVDLDDDDDENRERGEGDRKSKGGWEFRWRPFGTKAGTGFERAAALAGAGPSLTTLPTQPAIATPLAGPSRGMGIRGLASSVPSTVATNGMGTPASRMPPPLPSGATPESSSPFAGSPGSAPPRGPRTMTGANSLFVKALTSSGTAPRRSNSMREKEREREIRLPKDEEMRAAPKEDLFPSRSGGMVSDMMIDPEEERQRSQQARDEDGDSKTIADRNDREWNRGRVGPPSKNGSALPNPDPPPPDNPKGGADKYFVKTKAKPALYYLEVDRKEAVRRLKKLDESGGMGVDLDLKDGDLDMGKSNEDDEYSDKEDSRERDRDRGGRRSGGGGGGGLVSKEGRRIERYVPVSKVQDEWRDRRGRR